jgi:hypothetical protein
MSRKTPALLVLLGTLAQAGLCQAAENTVEMQLDADPLLNLAVGRARSQAPCPEPLGFNNQWLDHMEFLTEGAALQLSDGLEDVDLANGVVVSGRRAQIVLPTIVATKSTACIDQVGCAATEVSMDILLGLRLQRPDPEAPVQLCAAVDDVSLAAPLHDPMLARVQQLVPETCVDIDIPVPTEELGLEFAGAAVSTDGQRLALRLAYGAPGTGDFESFLGGALGPGSADGFSLFIDRHLFLDSLLGRADEALANLPDELSVRSGPSGNWFPSVPLDGRPGIGLGLGLDLPICSIDVDAKVGAFFDLDTQSDELVMDLHSSVDVDEVALGFCAAGLALLGAPFVPGFEFLLASASAVAVDIVEGLGIGMLPIPGCSAVDDQHQRCRFGVALPAISFGGPGVGTLNLTGLTGHAQGLLLTGTFTAPAPLFQSETAGTSSGVVYTTQGSCGGGGFSTGYFGAAAVNGSGHRVCAGSGEVAGSDVKNVYSVSAPAVGSTTPANFQVTFNEATANSTNFWAATYPAKIKMFTSGGIHTVSVAAPVKATDQQKLVVQMKALKNRIVCDYQTAYPGPRAGWFDPRWLIDPPYDYAVNLVNGQGQTIRGSATIANLRFTSNSRTALNTFVLRTQGTAYADLVVGYSLGGRMYTFSAPVTFAIDQNMNGSRLAGGLTRLAPTARLAPTVTIPVANLPAGYRSGSAAVSVNLGSVAFEGIMR